MTAKFSIKTKSLYVNESVLILCYPFYYIKFICCLRDYNINDNYVQTVSLRNILSTTFANCVMVTLYITTMKYTHFSMAQYTIIYNLMYCEFLFYFTAVSFVNLYNTTASVRLLSVLHEINQSLCCRKDSKKFKLIACVTVFVTVMYSVTFFVFKYFFDSYWTLMRAVFVSVTLLLDIEIIYIVLFIYIITWKIRKWNDDLELINAWNENDDITVDIESNLENITHVMNSLIEAWNLLTETSGFKVMSHFITTFVVTLVYVTVMTHWVLGKFFDPSLAVSHTIGISLILPKMIMAEIALSVCCEAFYAEILRAKYNVIFKSSQDLLSKRRWRNIQRMLDTDIQEMTASGGFPMDAVFMVQFIKTVTAYTVVLLQFWLL